MLLMECKDLNVLKKKTNTDFSGCPVAKDSALPIQGPRAESLAREPGPTCCS